MYFAKQPGHKSEQFISYAPSDVSDNSGRIIWRGQYVRLVSVVKQSNQSSLRSVVQGEQGNHHNSVQIEGRSNQSEGLQHQTIDEVILSQPSLHDLAYGPTSDRVDISSIFLVRQKGTLPQHSHVAGYASDSFEFSE